MEIFQRPIEWEQELKGEEDNIKNAEKKADKLGNKIHKKKLDLQEKKENDWDWEERRLKERLKDLKQEDVVNDDEIDQIKEKIAEFKFKEIQIQKSQNEIEDSLLQAIKLNHLEEIVKRKAELQRIITQREDLERKELQNSAHLEALLEEQQRRDHQSLENMHRILNKAENLEKALKNGDLDRENQILLAHALEEGGDYAEKQRKRMVDEILAKRQREKQQKILKIEANMRELNEKRWQLVQKHEDLLKKRIIHQNLVSRGIDFLSEMEMGKIPNKDVIIQNLGEINVDMTEVDHDANEIVSKVAGNLDERKHNIETLKAEKEKTLQKIAWMNRPYRGEADIRRDRPDVDLSIYTAMKDLVYDFVEDTWNVIVQVDKNIKFIMQKKDYYMHKSKVLKAKALFYSEQQVLRLVSLLLVDEVIEEITYDVAEDMNKLVKFSENLITSFVSLAVIKQRGTKFSEEKMFELLKNMIRDNSSSN
ncbi:hypothetical protein SteCoe_21284 [Stentor coeruleus]|uniref:Uncharacterized protein n=1 Tax=Stentor coeruleus TaxID=5963 RepID=A0A1R2BQ56_9CILI|nr:hypothetical protein SteCoe_21284 [Stentor coeruleus]